MPILGSTEPRLTYNYGSSAQPFTASAATDKLTRAAHGLVDGQPITLSNSGGALPSPLAEDTIYWVRNKTTNDFELGTTWDAASSINITDAGTGTHYFTSAVQFDLDNSIILRSEPDYDNIWHKSQISGSAVNYHKGYLWELEIQVNLHKYSSPTPKNKFFELAWLLGREVAVEIHRDRDVVQDEDEATVNLAVLEVTPYYKETIASLYDACIIKLRSTEYVDIRYGVE